MAAVTLNTASPVQLQAAQRGATVLRIDAVYTELIGLGLLLGGEGMAEALGLLPIGLYNLLGVGMFLYGIGLWVARPRVGWASECYALRLRPMWSGWSQPRRCFCSASSPSRGWESAC